MSNARLSSSRLPHYLLGYKLFYWRCSVSVFITYNYHFIMIYLNYSLSVHSPIVYLEILKLFKCSLLSSIWPITLVSGLSSLESLVTETGLLGSNSNIQNYNSPMDNLFSTEFCTNQSWKTFWSLSPVVWPKITRQL